MTARPCASPSVQNFRGPCRLHPCTSVSKPFAPQRRHPLRLSFRPRSWRSARAMICGATPERGLVTPRAGMKITQIAHGIRRRAVGGGRVQMRKESSWPTADFSQRPPCPESKVGAKALGGRAQPCPPRGRRMRPGLFSRWPGLEPRFVFRHTPGHARNASAANSQVAILLE